MARALEERWEPTSELVLWQPVSGLSESEGLALLKRWQSQDLPPEEERARRYVGELLRWHPAALCLYAGEAHAASWQNVEALVLEGNLNPNDYGELAGRIHKSWERLSPADQEALSDRLIPIPFDRDAFGCRIRLRPRSPQEASSPLAPPCCGVSLSNSCPLLQPML